MNSFLKALIGSTYLSIKETGTNYPYWTDLRVLKVEGQSSADVARKPLATKDLTEEAVYTDTLDIDTRNAKIIQPVRLRITARADNLSTVESIRRRFADNTASFSITSRSVIANNMAPMNVIFTQSADHVSAVEIEMDFEQYAPPVVNSFDPLHSQDAPTYGVQIQQLGDTNFFDIGGIASGVTSQAKALYNRVNDLI